MNFPSKTFRALGVAIAVTVLPSAVFAAPFVFTHEDLLLGVKAESGQGTSQNVFFNLGNTVTIKNSPNQGVVGNIAEDLSLAFGDDWFTRTDLAVGVIGNRNHLSPTFDNPVPPQEPTRTLYVSVATTAAGGANLRPAMTSNSLGTTGTNYASLKSLLMGANSSESLEATDSGATVMDQTLHPVSWNNSWTKWNPLAGGAAFGTLTGGIQNRFGTGSEVLVDVQRMVGSTPATYVTTVGIASNGDIRLFTGGTQTPFEAWVGTFPALDTAAKRLATADPDGDGITNLMEFLLDGNPGTSDTSILPDVNVSGSNFAYSFNRRDDAKAGSTLIFQYSSNLTTWTDVAVDSDGGVVGSATVGVTENATSPDAILITLPKTVAVGDKLFGRLIYTQP